MGWTSSTAVIGAGTNGVIATTSNNALIEDDRSFSWTGNYLEVYGANDTVIGGYSSDSIGAVVYPAIGMNGNYANIDGNYGGDVLIACAMQGEQYATLTGGNGIDTLGFGCNIDSRLNVEVTDFLVGFDNAGIFYEGYQPGTFTCYSTDKGLLITDNAGRLTVMLDGVSDYNSVANGYVYIYPYGVRAGSGLAAASTVWYGGTWTNFGSAVRYGGAITGLELNGNVLSVDDWHSGGVVTNGVYGYEGIVVIDNTHSTQSRYLGGNAQANQIYAGTGDDTLWGAANDDILIGGAGANVFICGAGKGADFIAGADTFDTVNLYNLNLSDLAAVVAENDTITLAQDAANAVTVQYSGTLSPTFALADGTRYRFDNTTSAWQQS